MKYIYFILFFLTSLLSFSQSEIWGVHNMDGIKNGGFLYTIDSSTNQVIIQHRFGGYYSRPDAIVIPQFSEKNGNWLSADGNYLIKFNETFNTLENRLSDGLVYGNYTIVSDSIWYILEADGLMKVNPETLNYTKIKGFKPLTLNSDNGLVLVDNQYLVWQQVNENRHGYICKLDLETEEVTLEFDLESYQDASYFPVGKLIPYNGRYYGLTYQRFEGKKYLLIFSYQFENNDFKEEYRIESKRINRNTVNGLVLADDGKFYSAAPINRVESDFVMFSFDPRTNTLDSLTSFRDEIGSEAKGPFTINNNMIYGNCISGGSYGNGSIFKYNIQSHKLDSLFSFGSNSIHPDIRTLTSTSDGNLIGTNIIEHRRVKQLIYSYNLNENKRETIFNIDNISTSNSGTYPSSMIQLDNGEIVCLVLNWIDKENDTATGIYSSALLQFKPQTKEMDLLTKIYLNFSLVNEIYKLSDNRIFIPIRNETQNSLSRKMIYNIETNQIDSLQDFPADWYIHNIVMESDSIIYFVKTKRLSAPPNSIIKYNIFTDEFTEIKEYASDILISNFIEYDENYFIFQTTKEQVDSVDSVFLNKLNRTTGEITIITNLNQYTASEVDFIFKFSVIDHVLIGDLIDAYYKRQQSNKTMAIRKIISLNIESLDFNILAKDSVSIGSLSDWDNFHSFIDAYENEGSFFTDDVYSFYYDAGSLKKGNIHSLIVNNVDYFENGIKGIYYGSEPTKNRLKKFKKMDFYIHWLGAVSSDWYNSENWFGGLIPDSNSLVCIDAFRYNEPVIDSRVKCKQLLIMEDAKLIVSETGTLSLESKLINHGSVVIQGDFENRGSIIFKEASINKGDTKYFYQTDSSFITSLASPVESVGFRESIYYEISDYSTGENYWNPISYYPFIPDESSAYLYKSDFENIEFSGVFNFGDYSLDIPRSSESQLYPLPNPYPSSLDWRTLDLSHLNSKALYKFNSSDSTFSVYIDGLGDASPLIQPLDVFWVCANAGNYIPLDNEDRIHAIDFKKDSMPERNELIIKVQGKDGSYKTHISFNPNASSNYDEKYDALKSDFPSIAPPQIFTFGGEEKLVINQLPDTALMDLAVTAREDGAYTVSIEKHQDFNFVVLEDLIWKKRIDLLKQDYTFEYFTSDGDYPFKLYFEPWALEPIEDGDIEIYYYPESIVVRSRKQIEQADIIFYDLAGRIALQLEARDFHYYEQPISLPVGHYIVQVRTSDLVVNRKVLVRR